MINIVEGEVMKGIYVKRIVSVVLVLMLIFQSENTNYLNQVRAEKISINLERVISTDSNVPDLRDNYDEESPLCKKLEYDKENNVTELSEEVEKELNEVGIWDSEIEQFDDGTIEKLENAINTEVYIDYCSVDNKTGEEIEMSEDEINDMISEKIENGDIKYEEQRKSLFSNILEFIGFLPSEVKAKTETKSNSETKKSASGAVKHYMICSQVKEGNKRGKIYVTYTATWLEEAYYRNKDVCGVTVSDNAVIDSKTCKCYHNATFKTYNEGTCISKKLHTEPKTHIMGDSGSGVAFIVNLFGDRNTMQFWKAGGTYQYYINESITVTFCCEQRSKKAKILTFTSKYSHSKTNKSFTPSISLSKGGLSVGVSKSGSNYYSDITNNIILNFKPIK